MGQPPLSPAEIESLLVGVNTAPAAAPEVPASNEQLLSQRLRRLTQQAHDPVPADADRTGSAADCLRRLRLLHQGCARDLSAALSASLRAATEVIVAAVERCSFAQFALDQDQPTCFVPLITEGSQSGFALAFDLAILVPAINRLLGGGLETACPIGRPLTEIEQRLAVRIARVATRSLESAWERVQPVRWSVAKVEHQMPQSEVPAPPESIAWIRFQIAMGAARGAMSLVIPWAFVERIDGAHWRDEMLVAGTADADVPGSVDLATALAEVEIAADELAGLQPGDVITTDRSVDDLLEVTIDGTVKYRARPGELDGHRAIRLE